MKTILIILVTLAADFLFGFLIKYNKKKQLKRDEDLFLFKLEQILSNKSVSYEERIDKAKELCRNTKGKMATGAYFSLGMLD